MQSTPCESFRNKSVFIFRKRFFDIRYGNISVIIYTWNLRSGSEHS